MSFSQFMHTFFQRFVVFDAVPVLLLGTVAMGLSAALL
jgi:hypothetical protein